MKDTYTIPQDRREHVEKLIARFQKKAAKYGKLMAAEYGPPYAVRRPVYVEDFETHRLVKVDESLVEVFDLTIESEIVQKDGYTVVAKIEHLENGNLVNAFGCEAKEAWRSASCICEHCNVKRNRAVTFIVRNEDGAEKQIGRACLKDYCGIDPQMIGRLNELRDLVLNEDVRYFDFGSHQVSHVYTTSEALAAAVHVYKRQGYVKSGEPNSNRGKLAECIRQDEITDADRLEAEKIIAAVKAMSERDAIDYLLDKVQVLSMDGYCKDTHFGYIAYAPAAYDRCLEKMKKRKAIEEAKRMERQESEYIGQVGKRIDIDIADMKLLTSFETDWGYTFLYKFTDTDGNVLIWFASNSFGHWTERGDWEEYENVKKIRATVKEHTERDGIKQTIITRCKAA